MPNAQQENLSKIRLMDGTELPALTLENTGIILAIGDREKIEEIQKRWADDNEYLHEVARGLDTQIGLQFVQAKLGHNELQYFPYKPADSSWVAPCLIRETNEGNGVAVVIYSYGPM